MMRVKNLLKENNKDNIMSNVTVKTAENIFKDNGSSLEENTIKINVSNFNFYYGKTQALKDITFDVGENTVVGIIGPSGCGKSTFLRSLNRMNDTIPSVRYEGEIVIDDVNIFDKSVDVVDLRREVGMVFQKSNPFPKSIFENVAYGLKINGVKDKQFIAQRVEESLKHSALWDEVKDRL
ncbi:MAG: phosphate transport system ATP-binding protein, partial [Candidatus Omnitrophota bacterium]